MRALIVCPGRGSYERTSLGSLKNRSDAANLVLDACDAHRTRAGRPPVRELDAADAYKSSLHVAGEHASLLTFACGMADLAELSERFRVVGVLGNSMGFYTALAASGALPLADAVALVDTMGVYQEGNVLGGQVLHPISDEEWRADPARRAGVDEVLASIVAEGHVAEWSIDLGGYAVLGGDAAGVKALLERLPKETRGGRTFPVQLPLHSAFHTSLMQATSARAFDELGGLGWRAPDVPLIDGRGYVFRPRWADPGALRDYTLGHQVVRPFDFTKAVHTALHHCAPDVVVALGPGNALGGPLARTLVAAHWRNVRTRDAFEQAQKSSPILLSFGVPEQRDLLVGPPSRGHV